MSTGVPSSLWKALAELWVFGKTKRYKLRLQDHMAREHLTLHKREKKLKHLWQTSLGAWKTMNEPLPYATPLLAAAWTGGLLFREIIKWLLLEEMPSLSLGPRSNS